MIQRHGISEEPDGSAGRRTLVSTKQFGCAIEQPIMNNAPSICSCKRAGCAGNKRGYWLRLRVERRHGFIAVARPRRPSRRSILRCAARRRGHKGRRTDSAADVGEYQILRSLQGGAIRDGVLAVAQGGRNRRESDLMGVDAINLGF
jgi:hypothetical protein